MQWQKKILKSIKVVDMSTCIVGPTCARILGDWGADVIKGEKSREDPITNCPAMWAAARLKYFGSLA